MPTIVWLYSDGSPASERVAKELARRKIRYETVWEEGSGRLMPTLEDQGSFFQGLANIEVYYFGLLDSGGKLHKAADY